MKKYINLFLSILCSLFLFSCASGNNLNTTKTTSIQTEETIEDSSYDTEDETLEEDYEEDDEEEEEVNVKEIAHEQLPKKRLGDVPTYQQIERQIKKVEVKKIVIKPLTDMQTDPHELTKEEVEDFLANIAEAGDIEEGKDYLNPNIKHLMDNYKNILKTSSVCCVSSIAERLKFNGVSGEQLLSILKNDARDYFVQETCMIISEKDIKDIFKNKALANIIIRSRTNCICNNQEFLRKNINNFYKIYNEDPEFYKEVLIYRYRDKQGRIIEHDINESVLNIAITLENCIQ